MATAEEQIAKFMGDKLSKQQSHSTITTAVSDKGVYYIRFSRPKQKNPVNIKTYQELIAALAEAEKDDKVIVLVVTGTDDYFSAGADLKDMDENVAEQSKHILDRWVSKFMFAYAKFRKPIIAAVNGGAIGIGVTILTQSDIVFAVKDSFFWTPFARIGVVPEFGSSLLFPEILGKSLANEMLFASRKISSEEAREAKMVSRIASNLSELHKMVAETANEMITAPLALKTMLMYKALIKFPERQKLLESAMTGELTVLGKRQEDGDMLFAISELMRAREKEKGSKAKL